MSEHANVVHNPHDKFFKTTMRELKVARGFFEQHLPETVKSYLELNTLELEPGSYIDKDLDELASDVLYKVDFKEGFESAYLYILVEHQSSVDNLMPFRLWQYILSIWNECLKKNNKEKLPLVIPLVFYHGHTKYNGPKDLKKIIDAPLELIEHFLFQPFDLIDTHDIADEDLEKQSWFGLMEFVMKHVYAREALNHIQPLLTLLGSVFEDKGGDRYTTLVLSYYMRQLNTADPGKFTETLKQGLSEFKGDAIMGTLANYLIEQGVQKGEIIGIQKGESAVLLYLLERKFGAVPSQYLECIQKANNDTLLQWAAKVLDAHNIEAVFNNTHYS